MAITQVITTPPAAPTPGEDPAVFNTKILSRLSWDTTNVNELNTFASQANALETAVNAYADAAAASALSAVNAPGTSATSTTSMVIGTGAKSCTIQTGKSIVVGMWIAVANTAAPDVNYMIAVVTSHNSSTGALGFTVPAGSAFGSGTFTAWTISLSPPPSGQYLPLVGGVISANSATAALRISQLGSGDALVVEDSANPDATPFVIDANGRVCSGNAVVLTGTNSVTGRIQSQSNSIFEAGIFSGYWANDANPAFFQALKSRGALVGTRGIVLNNDSIGRFVFGADDGVNFIPAAYIDVQIDGTPGANDMPGRLVFSTTADGASSPTERMRIDSAGRIGIGFIPNLLTSFLVGGANPSTATGARSVYAVQTIPSNVTSYYIAYHSVPKTADAAFTLTDLSHFKADPQALGVGSTVTNQYGFIAESTLIGATNNFGFYSAIPSGTGRWNVYSIGTAPNYFGGDVIQKLSATVTPANNSELMMQLTSNTQLTIKVKGTDGTVRSVNLALA